MEGNNVERFNSVRLNLDVMTLGELSGLREHVITRVQAAQSELELLDEYMVTRDIQSVVAELSAEGLFNGTATK